MFKTEWNSNHNSKTLHTNTYTKYKQVKNVYNILNNNGCIPTGQTHWNKQLNITPEQWKKIYTLPYLTTKDTIYVGSSIEFYTIFFLQTHILLKYRCVNQINVVSAKTIKKQYTICFGTVMLSNYLLNNWNLYCQLIFFIQLNRPYYLEILMTWKWICSTLKFYLSL